MGTQLVRDGRRVAAAAVLCLAMSGVMAVAQDAGTASPPPTPPMQHNHHAMADGGPDGQERHLEMMTKKLNLSPDQVSQIKTIQSDTMTQAQGLHSDTTLSKEDRHSKMMDLHEAAMTKIRAVLNDDQKTKFDAMEAHRREHMQHEHGQAPPPPPPA